MQCVSMETDSRSPDHEIPRLLWNPNIHYCVHKNPPPAPNPSYVNPIHILTRYFFTIFLILSFHKRLRLFASDFPTKILSAFITSSMCNKYTIDLIC
jgi:hypothetical protein